MAGKDQHYDPRFLLKGFMSKRDGKKVFVCCFAKGSAPLETSTRNIGHSHLFYGRQGPGSLDAHITIKETKEYSVVVERVRNDEKIYPSDKDTLVEFVYFQAIRTRSTREQYGSTFVSVMKNMRQELGAPEPMAHFIRDTLHLDNKDTQRKIREKLREELKKRGRALSYKQEQIFIRQYLLKNTEEFVKREAPKRAFALDIALSAHLKGSDKLIKEKHNEALDKWLDTIPTDPGLGLSSYRQLHWSVQKFEDKSLILGDAAVLYRGADEPHLSAGLGKASLVLLPLSHNLLLIGAVDEAVELPSLDEINRSSAELSLNFFISPCRSQKEEEYHKLIGKRAPPVNEG